LLQVRASAEIIANYRCSLGSSYWYLYCNLAAQLMNAQQMLIYNAQFTLPNATTRATAADFAKLS
tara:strand:+ start:80 stop:274 length:195 start_codon:yes stop_codon:yes gene_type:complete